MKNSVSSASPHQLVGAAKIERFVWDITYACPLRCLHCYSESGRRASRQLDRDDAMRVIDVMISKSPRKVSFSGGEPLLVSWWSEAAQRLQAAGIPLTLHSSGWLMNNELANQLADYVTTVVVSVDGGTEQTHDTVRGRQGSFRKAMEALEHLARVKSEREARGERCYELGIDFTVTGRSRNETDVFVEGMTSRFSALDYVRLSGVIPCGLAEEESFEGELLTEAQLSELVESTPRLEALAKHGTRVSVTDVRLFRPDSPLSVEGDTHAHLEPDGQLRAFATYEAKVGSVVDVPIDELWARALAWRETPFVREQRNSIHNSEDWARAARLIDQRYGSPDDLVRISRRRGRTSAPEHPEH
jgi:MoaA/NifB/PqqE/SkfB family radical SAM enzyme